MKIIYTTILFFICVGLKAQIDEYMIQFRVNKSTDYELENKIINNDQINYNDFEPFLNDSLIDVRLKGYYLLYRRALNTDINRENYVLTLLKSCKDVETSLVGQNLKALTRFNRSDFSSEAKELIRELLVYEQLSHKKNVYQLAAYVGVGLLEMKVKLLNEDFESFDERWNINVAMSRLGDVNATEWCCNVVRQLPLNNMLVENIMPDLIYTRQKLLVDLCVEYLNVDEKLCSTTNPDYDAKIECGYRIMEIVAPIIKDFPYKTSSLGVLDVEDYEEALVNIRNWFENNSKYKIIDSSF